jgi:hypothetical protein
MATTATALTNEGYLRWAILEEAKQLAKEKYNYHLAFALSILYSKLRDSGDKYAATVAYQLMENLMEEEAEAYSNNKLFG